MKLGSEEELFFWTCEVELIKTIPISPWWPSDEMVRHYTKNGEFSVKSAYHIVMEFKKQSDEGSIYEGSSEHGFWNKL